MRDALAVYYFPGMWDWCRAVVLPLVTQSLETGLEGTPHRLVSRRPADFEAGAGMPGPSTSGGTTGRGGLRQSEGSGGGRSIRQHRRLYAQSSEPLEPERIVRELGGWFRRTWIRRSSLSCPSPQARSTPSSTAQ